MKNGLLKKTLVLGIMLVFAGAVFVPSTYGNIISKNSENIGITVRTNEDKTEINYHINNFIKLPVFINGKTYSRISLNDESNILSKGMPDVPNICRSIIIPDTSKMEIRVISSKFEEYKNVLIVPSKGNLPRTVDPDKIPYEFGSVYKINDWYPKNIAELNEPYILRDFRGLVVKINPVQYNPVKKTMRFYKDITVEVYPVGSDSRNIISREQLPSKVDADFSQIYKDHFINYGFSGRYTPVEEQGNMLIITYDAFWDAMLPFYEWKNMKGIPTKMINVSKIGNANAIKSYIANYYNSNGLTFVLLVGDAAQVPTLYAGGGASDPSYSYIVGNDHYPDLFVGRFSAENIAQVQTQVDRTITYERDPQAGAEWYKKGVGIGSEYGPGDDGEYDYQHIRNIRSLLLNFTYNYVDEFYGGSQGGGDAPDEPTPSMISTALDQGRSIINYCGHGWQQGWGTSGFSNSDVDALTNDNMIPFITSVACNNGEFDDTTCFGEAWLRATHNGQPTGAIGAYMSSVSQSWDPPMQAQDEFNNILVGLYMDNTKTSFGGLCYNGAMSMNDKYGADGWAMTDAWIVFGDPSVQVRTDTPTEMTVSHVSEIKQGVTTFNVTVTDMEGALCAISRNYNLLGYAYTNETGHAIIQFDQPIDGDEPLDLTVTAFNKMTYTAQITVITNKAPEKPSRPSGTTNGKPGVTYTYTFVTTDPDGDNVYYYIDWRDGTYSGWLGPYVSGMQTSTTHSWDRSGMFNIRVKAKDIYGHKSDWSDPLSVTMPLNQQSMKSILLQCLGI